MREENLLPGSRLVCVRTNDTGWNCDPEGSQLAPAFAGRRAGGVHFLRDDLADFRAEGALVGRQAVNAVMQETIVERCDTQADAGRPGVDGDDMTGACTEPVHRGFAAKSTLDFADLLDEAYPVQLGDRRRKGRSRKSEGGTELRTRRRTFRQQSAKDRPSARGESAPYIGVIGTDLRHV